MGTNEQGYHLLWPDLPIFLENQFTARPTPSSVLCCLCLRPKTVADFVQLRRARYGNTGLMTGWDLELELEGLTAKERQISHAST